MRDSPASVPDQHPADDHFVNQRTLLTRLLDGFDSKLTSSKWAAITKSSPDTALRDITDLVERGILIRDVGGWRSTSYSLAPF